MQESASVIVDQMNYIYNFISAPNQIVMPVCMMSLSQNWEQPIIHWLNHVYCKEDYGHLIGSIHAAAWSLNGKANMYSRRMEVRGIPVGARKLTENCNVHCAHYLTSLQTHDCKCRRDDV